MIYLCIGLAILLILASFYCIKFAVIILKIQDSLEEVLDVIDERYTSIAEICERPLFYDSPEIRRVVDDIKETRDALHGIAHVLSENFSSNSDAEVAIDERT